MKNDIHLCFITIKQADSNCEVIICYGIKITVISSSYSYRKWYQFGELPYVTVINDLWNSTNRFFESGYFEISRMNSMFEAYCTSK